MDKERKLAEKEGRLDPVHQCWEDTNVRWIQIHPRQQQNLNYVKLNPALVWVWVNFTNAPDLCLKPFYLDYNQLKCISYVLG